MNDGQEVPARDAYHDGDQLAAWCDHCRRWHHHGTYGPPGQGDGLYWALCDPDGGSPLSSSGYVLHEVGRLTPAVRRAYRDRDRRTRAAAKPFGRSANRVAAMHLLALLRRAHPAELTRPALARQLRGAVPGADVDVAVNRLVPAGAARRRTLRPAPGGLGRPRVLVRARVPPRATPTIDARR